MITTTTKKLKSDAGDSLVEVIVAMMIMGLFGLALVGALISAQPMALAFNKTAAATTQLTLAADQISLQPFAACSTSKPQPYVLTAATQTDSSQTAFAITTSSLPIAIAPIATSTTNSTKVSFAYTATLAAAGVTGPYTWTVSPALPNGLTLSSAGVITGTPQTEIASNYLFTATAASGATAIRIMNLTVATVQPLVHNPADTTYASTSWTACGDYGTAAATQVQQVNITTTVGKRQITRTIVKTA